jgi:hypothetical protein
MPMTEKQLQARDAKRDIGVELLASVRQIEAGAGKVPGVKPKAASGTPVALRTDSAHPKRSTKTAASQ